VAGLEGVVALGGWIVGWDLLARRLGGPTITHGIKVLWRHPLGRLAVAAGIGALIAHVTEGD
jgi:hypothetical protein